MRYQVVTRKTGFNINLVTHRAQVFNIFQKDDFHRITSHQSSFSSFGFTGFFLKTNQLSITPVIAVNATACGKTSSNA
jgi:hypothetical protein